MCTHGREKRRCKECGGSALCLHGRQRRQCKDCGGAAICPHRRIKYGCKECRSGQAVVAGAAVRAKQAAEGLRIRERLAVELPQRAMHMTELAGQAGFDWR